MSNTNHRLPRPGLARPLGSRRRDAIRKGLLAAGILSSLLYIVATDGIAASMWEGYHRTERMVSELFAVGSPGRDFLVTIMWFYMLLFVAFGIGVWTSTRGNRAMRVAACLLMGYAVFNIVAGFFPLRLGEETSVPMHIAATAVQLVLMVASMCFVAVGVPGRLRIYTTASLALMAVMAVVSFIAAPGPDLLLGIGERISIGAFLLWVAVLAVTLWNPPTPAGRRASHTPAHGIQ